MNADTFFSAVRLAVAAAMTLGFVGGASAFDLTVSRCVVGDPPPIVTTMDETVVAATGDGEWEQVVVELVNQERWDNGQLPPLKRVELLDSAAGLHSFNMADRDFMAHCDPDTLTSPWDRMNDAGYDFSAAAENIAAGYSSPASVMAGWMSSSGHRANILSTGLWEIGVGYTLQSGDAGNVRRDLNGDCVSDSFNNGPYAHYWTQNFGRRSGVYPVVINREAASTESNDVDLYLYGGGGIDEMRIRNDGEGWTAWQAFTSNVAWQLSDGPGVKQVFVEVRAGSSVFAASDSIISTALSEGEIFLDAFESGDVSAWSLSVP